MNKRTFGDISNDATKNIANKKAKIDDFDPNKMLEDLLSLHKKQRDSIMQICQSAIMQELTKEKISRKRLIMKMKKIYDCIQIDTVKGPGGREYSVCFKYREIFARLSNIKSIFFKFNDVLKNIDDINKYITNDILRTALILSKTENKWMDYYSGQWYTTIESSTLLQLQRIIQPLIDKYFSKNRKNL